MINMLNKSNEELITMMETMLITFIKRDDCGLPTDKEEQALDTIKTELLRRMK